MHRDAVKNTYYTDVPSDADRNQEGKVNKTVVV